MFCTELASGERCNGCPYEDNVRDPNKRSLEPHMQFRLATEVADILGRQTPDVTRESFEADVLRMMNEQEPAYQNLGWLAFNIASWKILGSCEHYEGVVLYDPEDEARMQEKFKALITNANNKGELNG